MVYKAVLTLHPVSLFISYEFLLPGLQPQGPDTVRRLLSAQATFRVFAFVIPIPEHSTPAPNTHSLLAFSKNKQTNKQYKIKTKKPVKTRKPKNITLSSSPFPWLYFYLDFSILGMILYICFFNAMCLSSRFVISDLVYVFQGTVLPSWIWRWSLPTFGLAWPQWLLWGSDKQSM